VLLLFALVLCLSNMGNNLLCSEARLHCTEHCVQAAPSQRRDPAIFETQQCDPAGAVFSETLEELNDIDRQFLLFSSSANAVAVRWLVQLGANLFARDSNSTMCMHAACRSGSLGVIEALLGLEQSVTQKLLGAVDVAGWTPLHVAVFMGRPEIVLTLLKAGAPPLVRTTAGQTVLDLCSDVRTHDILTFSSNGLAPGPSAMRVGDVLEMNCPNALLLGDQVVPQDQEEKMGPNGDVIFEPFFVLRNPVITQHNRKSAQNRVFMAIARDIFHSQPGCGMSFLVASGCVRDYPMNLVNFLRQNSLNSLQVGTFLGEDFSLSKILRMEFINSLGLCGSGVISSLTRTFSCCGVPQSLQKIDRIIGSLSEVWWRQHGQHRPAASTHDEACDDGENLSNAASSSSAVAQDRGELCGTRLKCYLPSANALHQLLFSSMMLRWSLHSPVPQPESITRERWAELNRGIGCNGADLAAVVLDPIFKELSTCEMPALHFIGDPPKDAETQQLPRSAVAGHAQLQGWARLMGTGLPTQLGGKGAAGATSKSALGDMQVSSMLSEATASSRMSRCKTGSLFPNGAATTAMASASPQQAKQLMTRPGLGRRYQAQSPNRGVAVAQSSRSKNPAWCG